MLCILRMARGVSCNSLSSRRISNTNGEIMDGHIFVKIKL
jgi:hypothetical protein